MGGGDTLLEPRIIGLEGSDYRHESAAYSTEYAVDAGDYHFGAYV